MPLSGNSLKESDISLKTEAVYSAQQFVAPIVITAAAIAWLLRRMRGGGAGPNDGARRAETTPRRAA